MCWYCASHLCVAEVSAGPLRHENEVELRSGTSEANQILAESTQLTFIVKVSDLHESVRHSNAFPVCR